MLIPSVRQSSTDPHRGFGYVEFSLPEDAREAIDNMDASEIFGRVIKVNQAKPQKDHNEGLGSKTAVWEQVLNATLSRPFSKLLFSANEPRRRATPPNTMPWIRIPMAPTTNGKIQCKVLKASPKRVLARNEKPLSKKYDASQTQRGDLLSSIPVVTDSYAFLAKAQVCAIYTK